jgi:hypothetical protein
MGEKINRYAQMDFYERMPYVFHDMYRRETNTMHKNL